MNQAKDNINDINYEIIRSPAVAGQFYPDDKRELAEKINEYLSQTQESNQNEDIRAILVPHAGYNFSALVAAHAYGALRGKKVETVVIICNSHTSYFNGIALDSSDAWQTPLGTIGIDKELVNKIGSDDEEFITDSQVHKKDHTIEVQLPFLQTVLEPGFKIVPILFGNTKDDTYEKLAKALKKYLSPDDLIVISTDLSHYPNYEDAINIDTETLDKIKYLDINKLEAHIEKTEAKNIPGEETICCGIDGVKTIMQIAKESGWAGDILKYANSGDAMAGDRKRVVGYGAMVFSRESHIADRGSYANEQAVINNLNNNQQKELVRIAKETVETYVINGKIPEFSISDERLMKKEGAFVTLHKDNELRGCIGQIIPSAKPLWQVVQDMAIAAATEDNRFPSINKDELRYLDYEVSVLSAPQAIENWQDVELGKHGVIVKKNMNSGVFLPQVAMETGWDKEEFLSNLCLQKAGLRADAYKTDPELELFTFTAQVFSE